MGKRRERLEAPGVRTFRHGHAGRVDETIDKVEIAHDLKRPHDPLVQLRCQAPAPEVAHAGQLPSWMRMHAHGADGGHGGVLVVYRHGGLGWTAHLLVCMVLSWAAHLLMDVRVARPWSSPIPHSQSTEAVRHAPTRIVPSASRALRA